MHNFQTIDTFTAYISSIYQREDMVDIDSENSSENLLFFATKELRLSDISIYDLPTNKITIFPLTNINSIIAFHIYLEPIPTLLNKIIDDLGDYEGSGGWGIGSVESMPKVFIWKHNQYQIELRKGFKSVKDFVSLPPQDVISIGTDLYEDIKQIRIKNQ